MDWLVLAARIGVLIILGLITGGLAARKGYQFASWFFTGGIIGLLVLAFLPFANSPELPDWEKRTRAEKGNNIGRKIGIALLAIVMLRLAAN